MSGMESGTTASAAVSCCSTVLQTIRQQLISAGSRGWSIGIHSLSILIKRMLPFLTAMDMTMTKA